MAAHALLSPSAAERWINCPASVFLNKDIPDEGSVYADEGTAAHTVMELAGRDYFNGFQWEIHDHRRMGRRGYQLRSCMD